MLMERLLDVSVFQCCPFKAIFEFNTDILRTSCNADKNIFKEDLILHYRKDFVWNEEGNPLMGKFSESEMKQASVKTVINDKIISLVREFLSNEKETVYCSIDNEKFEKDKTEFRAKSGIDGVKNIGITFMFEITKDVQGSTTICCILVSKRSVGQKISDAWRRLKNWE
jgi:hypothetical protein